MNQKFTGKIRNLNPSSNSHYPNSQGPQDTQGRDKGLNPYDNPSTKDWSIQAIPEEESITQPLNMD